MVVRRNTQRTASQNIFGKKGHIYISKKKGFIAPNINYANLDKVTIEINTAYIVSFNNPADYQHFVASFGMNKILFSKCHNGVFTFNTNRLLFGGTLTVHRNYKEIDKYGSHSARVKLKLFLNLTRMANYIHTRSPEEIYSFNEYMNDMGIELALVKDRTHSELLEGLDGEDNVMPLEAMFDLRPARKAFNLYLNTVLAHIKDAVENSAEGANAESTVTEVMQGWNVKDAECYWEYICPDAISLVKWLQDSLPHLFSKASVANYIYDDTGEREDSRKGQRAPTRGRRMNCPSLTLGLGNKKIDLAIYAKLLDRVRFEVKFRGNLKQLVNVENDLDMRLDISKSIDAAIIRAHKYLKRTFKHIDTKEMPEKMDVISFTHFLGIIAQTTQAHPPQVFNKMLPLLLTIGGVDVDKNSTEHSVCRLLTTSNILRVSKIGRAKKNTQRYVLLPKYHKVLQTMLGTLGPARVRERTLRRRNSATT